MQNSSTYRLGSETRRDYQASKYRQKRPGHGQWSTLILRDQGEEKDQAKETDYKGRRKSKRQWCPGSQKKCIRDKEGDELCQMFLTAQDEQMSTKNGPLDQHYRGN